MEDSKLFFYSQESAKKHMKHIYIMLSLQAMQNPFTTSW